MNDSEYRKIANYLQFAILPTNFKSNKANFIATANQYALHAHGHLTRNGKKVALASQKMDIFEALHSDEFLLFIAVMSAKIK